MTDKTPKSTSIRSLLQKTTQRLQQLALTTLDKQFAHSEAEILLSYAADKGRSWLIAHDDESLSPHVKRTYQDFIRRRVKHEPIAYIVGEQEFYGRSFHVTRDTLIPRSETEMLVEFVKENKHHLIWDVGTGSGAIAVTLAKEIPDALIIASDISDGALLIAKQNARRHGVTRNIHFMRADLLSSAISRVFQKTKENASLAIIANLPYLPNSDKKILTPDVVKYEPSNALFAGDDGLTLITKLLEQIATNSPHWNFSQISMYFEFDPPQTKKLSALSKKLFPQATITIHKDCAKRNRVLEIKLPSPT